MPKKAVSKRKSLVDLAKNTIPPHRNSTYQVPNFVDRLSQDHQEQLRDLRDKFVSGELGIYWTPRTLLREIIEPAGIDIGVSLQTWRKWLHERNHK